MLGNAYKIIQISTKTQTKDYTQKLKESEFFLLHLSSLSLSPQLNQVSVNIFY